MGQKKLLPVSDISNLPDVVKRQVLEPNVKDKEFGMAEREKIAKRLVSAFQIKFEKLDGIDSGELKPSEIVIAEFGAYLKTFPYALTGSEILEAYRMASRGELRDFLGNQIQFFPTLSTAQAGRILMAYQEFKIDNQQHTLGIEKLKKLIAPAETISEDQRKEQRKKLKSDLYCAVKSGKDCNHAFLFYNDILKKGALSNFKSNEKAQTILIRKKMREVILQEKAKIKSAIFNKSEINDLLDFLSKENGILHSDFNFTFQRLQGMAITLVKNDLVYNWIKKQIKKNAT